MFNSDVTGSAKEMEDVKQAYCKYKGDMDKVLQTVIGADANNEDRCSTS